MKKNLILFPIFLYFFAFSANSGLAKELKNKHQFNGGVKEEVKTEEKKDEKNDSDLNQVKSLNRGLAPASPHDIVDPGHHQNQINDLKAALSKLDDKFDKLQKAFYEEKLKKAAQQEGINSLGEKQKQELAKEIERHRAEVARITGKALQIDQGAKPSVR